MFSLERKQGAKEGIADCGLRIAGCGLRIADCEFMSLFDRAREIEIENCVNPQSAIRNPQSAIPLSLAL